MPSSLSDLGLHDKYQIGRIVNGIPSVIAISLAYPAGQAPKVEALSERLAILQRRYPSLKARFIYDTDSSQRGWIQGAAWTAEQLITAVHDDDCRSMDDSLIMAMRLYLDRVEPVSKDPSKMLQHHPLFRVISLNNAHLVLVAAHLLCDGKGALNLFRALLMPAEGLESLPDEHDRPFALPHHDDRLMALEDVAPTEGSVTRAAESVRAFGSVNKTDGKTAVASPPWPGTAYTRRPASCPAAWCGLHLDGGMLQRLKEIGKTHGVRTLGPALHTSLAVAMWSVLSDRAAPWSFGSSTAIDDRAAPPVHPHITGNYFTAVEWRMDVQADDSVWDMIKHYRDAVNDKDARARVVQRMKGARHLASLDDMVAAGLSKEAPYSNSLLFSNLTGSKLPEGATDIMWSQEPSPATGALIACLIGSTTGCHASICFRDGGVVHRDQVQRVVAVWKHVLERLAEAYDSDLAGLVPSQHNVSEI